MNYIVYLFSKEKKNVWFDRTSLPATIWNLNIACSMVDCSTCVKILHTWHAMLSLRSDKDLMGSQSQQNKSLGITQSYIQTARI